MSILLQKTRASAAPLADVLSSSDYDRRCSPKVFMIEEQIMGVVMHSTGLLKDGMVPAQIIVLGTASEG